MNPLELVQITLPEIVLTVLALGVLLVDVTVFSRSEPIPTHIEKRARFLGGITAVGILVSLGLVCWQMAMGVKWHDDARIIVVDNLNLLFTALILVLALGAVVISIGYELTAHVGEYFCITLFATIGAISIVCTENLLMFLVGLELLSVCLYILTAFHKGLLRSAEAAVKYFMFGALSTAFLLFGLSYVVGITGASTLTGVADAITSQPSPLLFIGMLFVVVGLAFKIAVVPFHLWAPDAYEGAPTPVVSFIATVSKVGSFVIAAKIFIIAFAPLKGSAVWEGRFSPGWALVLAGIAAASMVWGNVAASSQKNTKRMLAYSSVAHAGYILVGIIAATSMGMSAVLYYLVAYALTNLGAFGVISALTRQAGGDDIEDLDGMVHRAPFLSLLLLVFILSLAGIPPLAGFFGKFFLFTAAMEASQQGLLWLVVTAIATSAVSLYYYVNLLRHVFVMAPRSAVPAKSPWHWTVVLTLLAAAVVVIGAHPAPLLDTFDHAVKASRSMSAPLRSP